ncbi:MFS transporter [Brachybacterium saurashtrense]|uniref:MFS transporter n=1 Tax=Brachybacterium saurashtrense TaxID=556288 RepID=A0A345YKE4_9MICO|nr:MFS transporter [Brachybacterium saurashtrense]AXK44396.1 MFS transporter [Brachybacterium saurashtrense]RRR23007.1 MFS transporter [Brachybacterium saurashtrense]
MTHTAPDQTVPPDGAAPAAPHELPARRRTLALLALALGGVGIGASEFATMGLLPGIAEGLLGHQMATDPDAGIAKAGHLITAYALGVVVGAPVLALLSVRWSRTSMITALAAALAVGTVLSALMPTFELTVAARFLAGLPHGAYFGVASLLAASLMGPGSQGKGVAVALSGLTVANLVGVPLMTALGQAAGWRTVYLVITAIFVATVLALRWAVPPQEAVPGRRAVDEILALRRLQLWIVMGIAAVGFAGGFAVFSYVADITTRVAGGSAGFVPWVLAAAGLGMTLGNVLGGITTDRSLRGTLLVGFPLYIAALVGLYLAAPGSPVALLIGFFAVNVVNSALGPALQTWLIRVAHRSEVLGASLNHAAFNVANALGAALGGAVIAGGLGYRAPMVVAIVLASTGLVMVAATLIALEVRSRRTLAVLTEHEDTFTGSLPVIDPEDVPAEAAPERATTGA